jgi:hypothetical protein
MRQLHRQMMHTRERERAKRIKFEAGIMRDEYRNCIIRFKISKEGDIKFVWLNPPPNYCKEYAGYATHTQDTPDGNRYLWDDQEATLKGCNVLQPGDYLGTQTEKRYAYKGDEKRVTGMKVFYNCLLTRQFDPQDKKQLFRVEVYLSTAYKEKGRLSVDRIWTMWQVDQLVAPYDEEQNRFFRTIDQGGDRRVAWHQRRELRQTRVFITYSLHRPITGKQDGEDILLKMADAIHHLFGDDTRLSKMVVFGRKLAADAKSSDNMWVPIAKARKEDYVFYGGLFDVVRNGKSMLVSRNSYVYDQFDTHVENVEVDGGVEIGPTMGHPHFHVMLTLTHFSYMQFDYYAMKYYLETLFKGLEQPEGKLFMLGNDADPFYGDNENPYVDVKLYPADNFLDALHMYVRKHATYDRVNDARTETKSYRYKPANEKRRAPARDSDDEEKSDPGDDGDPYQYAPAPAPAPAPEPSTVQKPRRSQRKAAAPALNAMPFDYIRATRKETPKDGFCMFHSISFYTHGDVPDPERERVGKELLREVAQYMRDNEDSQVMQTALTFGLLLDAQERLRDLHAANPNAGYNRIRINTLDDYLAQLKTGRLWAGEQEVYITSNFLDRTIQICVHNDEDPENLFRMEAAKRYNPAGGPTADVIYIVYNGTNHYEGLVDVELLSS